MNLAELKTAVALLPPPELTELAEFVRQCDDAVWDRQIDADFSGNGRLRAVLDEVRADIRVGRLEELP